MDSVITVDGHCRRRGPYSAAGEIARRVVPDAWAADPHLVQRHDVEILTVAPELDAVVPFTRPTLTSQAAPEERTRFYPQARSLRVAHGLVELLMQVLDAGTTIVVENADHLDATDAEFVEVALRRFDPQRIHLVLREGGGARLRLTAEDFVAGECISGDSAAYDALPGAARAALHDARADELEATGDPSFRLGAIPFHRERGRDPEGAGVDALLAALEHCVLMGFYEAVLDFGARAQALLDWERDPERSWLVVAKLATALTVLERPDDAFALYDEACASSALPSVHMQAAYGRAMVLTRFYDPARRDHQQAKAWVNTAIAIADLFPETERRAFNTTFNENGLALIEMHLGDLRESLRLVTAGLERLERELGPDQQTLHRSVLRFNRAQLLDRLGMIPEAIDEYGRAIAADAHHSEYYFERAGLWRRLGDVEAALADYQAAIDNSPPFPEPHYNRGDLLLETGDLEGALADFSYVLELDPEFVDARVNRAGIRYELGDTAGAAEDVGAGLALDPENAHLLCLRGVLAQDEGRIDDAIEAFDAALAVDPESVAALTNRAILAFENGDVDSAVDGLTRALAVDDDPTIRLNRAVAYEAAGRHDDAAADRLAAEATGEAAA